jgi:enolase
MPVIEDLRASEILDSRGRPTVKAVCVLKGGARASASVPSGASTGSGEALELRDGGSRYRGLGCRKAVQNICETIRSAVVGKNFQTVAELDRALCELDATPNKSRLGANAILAVSLSFARADATERGVPLYRYFGDILKHAPSLLPRPTINLFSGGKHAGGQVAIQDVLIVPAAARTMDEALEMSFAVYQAAAELIAKKYGMRTLRADEGGLAPPAKSCAELFEDAVRAIEMAGLKPGTDVALAIDVASTHFFNDGKYTLDGSVRDSGAMIELLAHWLKTYPIVSIEDGLAEDEWAHWPKLFDALHSRVLVLGDDFLCTNPARIERAVKARAANALLLKVNQIGTLSEAAQACCLARAAGWSVTVSARSGETEDDWLADLAVGWGGDQIKIGSITQSERLAKYNRLLEIERETGWPMNPWPNER